MLFTHITRGGKEKRIYEISTRLAKRGYDVHIYCMKWWKGKEKQRIENGVHLNAISKYYPLYSGKRRSIKQAVMFAFACFKLIKEDFNVLDVDHMPYFVLFSTKIVCLIKRKKLIATWNEVWGRNYWLSYMGIKGNFGYLVERLSANLPKKILSVSNLTTNKLSQEFSIRNVETISSGVDIDLINKSEPSSEQSDLFYCGRLLSHKNVDYLIHAVSILKERAVNLKCIIVGEGPEKDRLIKLSSDLDLYSNIRFYDFIEDQKELYSLIKATKLFVSPSTREGFGIAVLEANACGVPVLVIDHPDNAAKEIVANGVNGFISPLDPVVMADTISNYLFSKNSLDTKQHILDYGWDEIITRIEKAYKLI